MIDYKRHKPESLKEQHPFRKKIIGAGAGIAAVVASWFAGPAVIDRIFPSDYLDGRCGRIEWVGPKHKRMVIEIGGKPYFVSTNDGRFRRNGFREGDCVKVDGDIRDYRVSPDKTPGYHPKGKLVPLEYAFVRPEKDCNCR